VFARLRDWTDQGVAIECPTKQHAQTAGSTPATRLRRYRDLRSNTQRERVPEPVDLRTRRKDMASRRLQAAESLRDCIHG
jgi:hypothetical protein